MFYQGQSNRRGPFAMGQFHGGCMAESIGGSKTPVTEASKTKDKTKGPNEESK